MDLTLEQWIAVVYEFIKGENTYTISEKLGVLEDDMIDFEESFLSIKTIEDAQSCFGDTLLIIGIDMVAKEYDPIYVMHCVKEAFQVETDIAKEIIDFDGLEELRNELFPNGFRFLN